MGDYCNIIMDIPKSTQKTVTIDQELWYALDEWLKSKKAKKMGYHSKAQFCTEAVRELLDYHSMNKPSEQKILEEIGMVNRKLDKFYDFERTLPHDIVRLLMMFSEGKQQKLKRELEKPLVKTNR